MNHIKKIPVTLFAFAFAVTVQQSPPIITRQWHLKTDIPWHSGIFGTLSLAKAPVPADPPSLSELASTRTRVHRHGLVDDETIAQQLADGLARVGGGDFVDFVRIQPDLALAAADHGRGQALLGAKVDPVRENCKNQLTEFDHIMSSFLKDMGKFVCTANSDRKPKGAGF